MKKLFIAVGIAVSFLFSGCAAVVQGGAALMAKNASDHPASKKFVVSVGKNEAFNASMRSLTAKDRKVTSSDREAGVVQGEINGNAVTIKIVGHGSKESSVDITVAYAQIYLYGVPRLEDDLNTLVTEINGAGGKVKEAVSNAPDVVVVGDSSVVPAVIKKSKKVQKKAPLKTGTP